MDEFSFIDTIKQRYYRQPALIKGVGDDAAVFRENSKDIVTSVDTFVEGIHFTRETMEPFHAGYRALAANISDLAAMGSVPAFYLVSIVVPDTWSEDELKEVYRGMKEIGRHFRMDMIGGDTVSGKEFSLSITVIGFTEREKARYRHTAQDGDVVFVTGTLGCSQAGFHILTNPGNYQDKAYFIDRHRIPFPRAEFGAALGDMPRVALNDISDGIANETAEIAEASQVVITLQEDQIPVAAYYGQFTPEQQHHWKLYGGEDFELAGTVAEENWPAVEAIAARTNTKISRIGYVSQADTYGKVFLEKNGRCTLLQKKGYTHLSR
ncbi:thiamine-phosphate kinase [Lentibacillus sediminis]|uniref:thiamine-phosphate kinase n=1 Tax=Lentibacillus sediminis TaxID=1940529 RepID=UPI000C1C811A|nr:thiamine-phosphate kinase [Lentibacillus sediminis]